MTGETDIAGAIATAETFLPLDAKLGREPRNDFGNARRLIERHGADLMYVDKIGWHAWVGTHWSAEDGEAVAVKRAHEVARAVRAEAAALEAEGPYTDDQGAAIEAPKDFEDRIAAHRKWASTSGNMGRTAAMIEAARPYLRVPVEALDRDRLRLTVRNGTLVFDRGKAALARVDHERAHRITRCAPVDFDPEAKAPRWQAFLETVQPVEPIRRFLQVYLGYCLTGLTDEQLVLCWQGQGANGKGTAIDALSHVLGPYLATIDFASLLHDDRRTGSQATPDIARLPGTRLVVAAEPEQGARLSEARIKALSGQDMITARHLNEAFFEFMPQFKLVLSFNNRPSVRGTDEGTWRRIKLVPWPVIVPRDERDRLLRDKLRAEASGILNWLIEGALEYLREGLIVPGEVDQASEDYRTDSNPVATWVDTQCRRLPAATTPARTLYEAYCAWCKENALEPVHTTSFGKALGAMGFVKEKAGIIFWKGIAPPELPPEPAKGDPRPEPPAHGEER